MKTPAKEQKKEHYLQKIAYARITEETKKINVSIKQAKSVVKNNDTENQQCVTIQQIDSIPSPDDSAASNLGSPENSLKGKLAELARMNATKAVSKKLMEDFI